VILTGGKRKKLVNCGERESISYLTSRSRLYHVLLYEFG